MNNKNRIKTIIALILAAALTLIAFASCSGGASGEGTTAAQENTTSGTEAASETQTEAASDPVSVRVAVLNGTTGFGIAPLYRTVKENYSGNLDIKIDFYADATLVSPLLISGSADVAAVPTNLASVLYNRTEGKIKVLAVNTLGVLYLLENGNTVNNLSDLRGKTVSVPGQGTNPEYVFRALLKNSGIEGLEESVTIDYTYPTPDDLTTAVATGKCSLAVLPEPKVTAAMMKNQNLRVALDFSAEWKNATGAELVQGCLVARAEFVEAHPEAVAEFCRLYEESVNKVTADPAGAATDIVYAGIVPNEALVNAALPKCNIVYLTGEEMKNSLNKFWKSLYDIIPSSVGGKLPDEGIF